MTSLVASLILLGSSLFASSSGSTYAVGACRPALPSFTTVGAAIAGVPAGATILVCPGTYFENELDITQPLTLEGISSADSALALIQLGSPSTYVVSVSGTGPVNISNLQFGGDPISGLAILFQNASGTLNHITVCSLPNTCPQLSVLGTGVLAFVDDGSSQAVSVENSNFLIVNSPTPALQSSVSSGTLNFTVQGNTIIGAPGLVLGGASTVSGNYIQGTGSGVGIFSSGGANISANIIADTSTGISSAAGDTVTQNKLVGNATGILASGTATFTHNTILNSNVGIDLGCTSSTATYNNFLGTGTGFNNVPSSFGTATNGFYSVPTIKGAICQ